MYNVHGNTFLIKKTLTTRFIIYYATFNKMSLKYRYII